LKASMEVMCRITALVLLGLSFSAAYRPLRPQVVRSFPNVSTKAVGEPLYLTPYIESGDIEAGKEMSRVDSSLLMGLDAEVESYSGFLTVDPDNSGNMFFWFFPAENEPSTAPVVIWLQGGPGGSSMFGLLKLHGPILTTVDENDVLTGVAENPSSWNKKHNMLYIDNPVGAGFSYSNKMPTTQDEVTDNLYEFLQQWYTLFPEYQSNPFYPFGESYAGKYVPSLTRRIHEMNNGDEDVIKINLAGMGIGDGWMSPYHNARYANFLYQVGLVDPNQRDDCLIMESQTQALVDLGDYYGAWESWSIEFDYFLTRMGCDYYYNIAECPYIPSEDNYEDFCNLESTREAIHVGNLPFPSGGNVYYSMLNVFMETQMHDIEFLLDLGYRTLIYDGNFDIICNHSGILDMLADMQWIGKENYEKAVRSVYTQNGSGDVIGYLTSSDSLRLLVVRNAGHMVPLSQPPYAQQMLEEFTSGAM